MIEDPSTPPAGAANLERLLESIIGIARVGVVLVSTVSIAGEVRGLIRRRRLGDWSSWRG